MSNRESVKGLHLRGRPRWGKPRATLCLRLRDARIEDESMEDQLAAAACAATTMQESLYSELVDRER